MTGGVVRRDALREAVLALHFPEKRYQPHPDAEWSVRDPEDCEDEDGNVVTDPHVFEVCAHCGSLEMLSDQHDPGDECPHAYQDSLWPCATARVLDAVPDVPPTEGSSYLPPDYGPTARGLDVERSVLPVSWRTVSRLPDVPPDPPAVDFTSRNIVNQVYDLLCEEITARLGDDEKARNALTGARQASNDRADVFTARLLLVAAADVRASALEDAADDLLRMPTLHGISGDTKVTWDRGVSDAARRLLDRAKADREGAS